MRWRSTAARFEPTYEELKQSPYLSLVASLHGFEPTYEELKLFTCDWKFSRVMGFEPTYEELKLIRPVYLALFDGVLSLPMRN